MLFTVTTTRGRDMELKDEAGNVLASIVFPKWYNMTAEITAANGTTVTIGRKGFWMTDMEATNGTEVLYRITTGWWGKKEIEGMGRRYSLRRTGMWRSGYSLYTPDEQAVVVVNWYYSFKGFKHRYELATADHADVNDPLLLCVLVYCVNMMRVGATAAV